MIDNKQYIVGYFDEPVDIDDYVEYNGKYINNSEVVDLLNSQEQRIKELESENQRLEDIVNSLTGM